MPRPDDHAGPILVIGLPGGRVEQPLKSDDPAGLAAWCIETMTEILRHDPARLAAAVWSIRQPAHSPLAEPAVAD